ncbi:MAG: redoxin domain-containing protein [Verrucomicrobia subdivision 3 bacterium]|nr:redoxin domain-containing protein [Limisphaerales bacterium]
MKKSIITLLGLVVSCSVALADAEVGKAAPGFTAKDVNGKTHSLADYKGKIVVLESYNLDCPYLANHYNSGAMQELQGNLTAKGDVVWLTVNTSYNDAQKAKKEATDKKIKSAVIHDPAGKIGKAYGFKTTPHMVVIDKEGKVAYNGAIDDRAETEGDPRSAKNYVKEAVAKLQAGGTVVTAKTKPYGCGIKYAN